MSTPFSLSNEAKDKFVLYQVFTENVQRFDCKMEWSDLERSDRKTQYTCSPSVLFQYVQTVVVADQGGTADKLLAKTGCFLLQTVPA